MAGLDDIVEDTDDSRDHPSTTSGLLSLDWLTPRGMGSARLSGWYALPGAGGSLPTLRAQFLPVARALHLPDLDASAIRLAEPRDITQQIARWVYRQVDPNGHDVAGVQFASRHGDELLFWAVFERPGDGTASSRLAETTSDRLSADDPELLQSLQTHRLRWSS